MKNLVRTSLSVITFWLIASYLSVNLCSGQATKTKFPFFEPSVPLQARMKDLMSRLTLEEKIQLISGGRGIARLGISGLAGGSECIHGLGRAGRATVFPQALGLSSTWNIDLMGQVSIAISDEVRAKHAGLICWSPNINLFRDPRWGRGQETYGEDPYLIGRMATAFIRGMQGDDPNHLKTACAVKHFAVHSGPDAVRHKINVQVSPKDLWETYLPHFKVAFKEAGAAGTMTAYNRINGEPCCASPMLLGKILREEWGFHGFVIPDAGSIQDMYNDRGHRVTRDMVESVALALRNGCDMPGGGAQFQEALKRGLITEADIDRALERVLTVHFRLGSFDPPEQSPYASISMSVVDSPVHRALALKAAQESIVLLRNEGNLLPLKENLRSITIVGPNASDVEILLGNYNGISGRMVTPLEGITAAVSPETRIQYIRGCDVTGDNQAVVPMAVSYGRRSDVIVVVLGLTPLVEGEEYDAPLADWIGDRLKLDLPGVQETLLKALVETGKPVVLVLTGCAPMTINWAMEHVPSIVQMGYAGEEGGTALADVLFGKVNPSGKLNVTWPKSIDQLPPFFDYAMAKRTYRFMTDEPLFPFGYGLSYTQFTYDNMLLSAVKIEAGQNLKVEAMITNSGTRAGQEVVQVYLSELDESASRPIRQLVGFTKVDLKAGESRSLSFSISPRQMAEISDEGLCFLRPGRFRVSVGGNQGDPRSQLLTNRPVLTAEFEVHGRVMELQR